MEFSTASPIWVQLVAEFSRRIVVGEWQPGSRVPGVREIAAEVGVNPNTAQRALAELERADLARSERTSGRFITDDLARIDALRADLARDATDIYISRVRGLGMHLSQATDIIKQRWDDPNVHSDHAAHTRTGGQ
jgi:DNA-binding transcriptional regulator YhcF (GntR family)